MGVNDRGPLSMMRIAPPHRTPEREIFLDADGQQRQA